MELHHGQTIERIVRRNGFSITELARLTSVNRRSVYNWFNQRHLKPEIIFRIGSVINCDFSTVFPTLYATAESPDADFSDNDPVPQDSLMPGANTWKDKYIDLLERHNSLLINLLDRSAVTRTDQEQD